MDGNTRAELAEKALEGYVNGPDAPQAATNLALAKVEESETVIIVEGISDLIAVEALAVRLGRDLDAEGIAVLPIGGAQAIGYYLRQLGPAGEHLDLAGLCDADATEVFRRGLTTAQVGAPESLADMADLGFHVCDEDLEDELIRAVGPGAVLDVVESQGELGPFLTFQQQPEWRDRPLTDQLRRFFGSKSRRSLRYARLLVDTVNLDDAPAPLRAVLDFV